MKIKYYIEVEETLNDVSPDHIQEVLTGKHNKSAKRSAESMLGNRVDVISVSTPTEASE